MAEKESEPRAHHFVPACWLAGFTETGDKDGDLWVTDLGRRKQWQTNPRKAGRIRDFYRVDDPEVDPLAVETALSKIEDSVAHVILPAGVPLPAAEDTVALSCVWPLV